MFGYLYSAEKTVKKDLMTQIAKLNANPGWAEALAARTQGNAAAYRTEVVDIERKMDGANIVNLRHWRDLLAKVNQAVGSASAPTPMPPKAAPPKPAPPKAMPAPPKAIPEKLPPAPPGIKCPHYSKASAFPENWDDPAAEQRYLDAHADVKNWVGVMSKRFKGKKLNALWHYRCYGKKEGRTWAGYDAEFGNMLGYLR